MRERRPRRLAEVLEDDRAAQASVAREIAQPLTPRGEHLLRCSRRQVAEVLVVVRRLDDDLVRTDAGDAIEQPLGGALEGAFHPEGGELVREDTYRPARTVRRRAGLARGEELRRRLVLVS